ncbi:MAG: hypothetical protein ACYCXW_14115 [Solirubrobacteraceae bacterium]
MQPAGSLERIYLKLSERLCESLEREMSSPEALACGPTRARVLAGAIASVICIAALAMIAGGAVLIATGWPNVVMVTLGALCLGVGLVTCPRPFRRSSVACRCWLRWSLRSRSRCWRTSLPTSATAMRAAAGLSARV